MLILRFDFMYNFAILLLIMWYFTFFNIYFIFIIQKINDLLMLKVRMLHYLVVQNKKHGKAGIKKSRSNNLLSISVHVFY